MFAAGWESLGTNEGKLAEDAECPVQLLTWCVENSVVAHGPDEVSTKNVMPAIQECVIVQKKEQVVRSSISGRARVDWIPELRKANQLKHEPEKKTPWWWCA